MILRYAKILSMAKPLIFFKEVRTELYKVVWPSKKQVLKLTLIVISVSVAVGAFIGGLDYVFTKIMAIALER